MSTFAIQKELFDISKAQRIGAVVMLPNRYQQLLTFLFTSVTQTDTIFFIIQGKDKKNIPDNSLLILMSVQYFIACLFGYLGKVILMKEIFKIISN